MSTSEGLSSNSIYSIFQDSYGVLWLGTLDGLNRYDGYEITTYKHDHQKKTSLSSNRITLIYEDHYHNLWLYDEFTSAIIKYCQIKSEFTTYSLEKFTTSGLEVVDSIKENNDSQLYVYSNTGYTLRYDYTKDKFELFFKTQPVETIANRNILITQLFDQYLKDSKSPYNAKTIMIRKIMKDTENRYWIATKYDGLYTATLKDNVYEFTSHIRTTDKNQLILSEEILDIYEDRSNVVWVGTKNNGLYRFTPYKYKFNNIESIATKTGVFQLGTLRAIIQDKNRNTWAGTNEHGLVRIDETNKTGEVYQPLPNDNKSIGHRFIRSLFVDNKENLWIGHYKGFSRYNSKSNNFITYTPHLDTDEEIRVYDFQDDKAGGIWMAAWDMILHFDPEKNAYQYISRHNARERGFTNENIRDLQLGNSGKLWIAVGEKGLSILDSLKNIFRTIHYVPSMTNGIPTNNIFDIYRDSRKNIWLSTADGLCQFNPDNLTCRNFTTNDGLPSNLIFGVLEDKHGNLWYSSTKGIGKFDPEQKTFRNYDVSDGLQSNEFTENAFYQNKDGAIYFGGINGLTYFYPDQIRDNTKPPIVSITNLKVFDRPLTEVEFIDKEGIRQKLRDLEEITLTPEQRSISIEFVGLHYVNPQKNKYAYKLEGFDKQWTYRNSNVRFANYTNLEPGTYYFKVKAANSDGIWSPPIQLKLVIQSPFYTTWWFIITTTLICLTLVIFGFRWRIENVKKQQSRKAIQLESELNFLKSQVNPHFLFNTLNNIYALCQTNSKNAAPMVGKISEMMRYMIYDCTGDLVYLQKEIDYLQNYIDLNQLKSNRKLNASMTVRGKTDGIKIAPLLLINFLENCFKHGDINSNGDGFISVDLSIGNNSNLTFIIRNSFRAKSTSEQKGIGLENVKHRLTLLYRKKHSLKTEQNNSIFEVVLKLQLD